MIQNKENTCLAENKTDYSQRMNKENRQTERTEERKNNSKQTTKETTQREQMVVYTCVKL